MVHSVLFIDLLPPFFVLILRRGKTTHRGMEMRKKVGDDVCFRVRGGTATLWVWIRFGLDVRWDLGLVQRLRRW